MHSNGGLELGYPLEDAQLCCRGTEDDNDPGAGSGIAVQMCLWCLNPALAFNAMADPAHAIILTSGTLAPMATFASEV